MFGGLLNKLKKFDRSPTTEDSPIISELPVYFPLILIIIILKTINIDFEEI